MASETINPEAPLEGKVPRSKFDRLVLVVAIVEPLSTLPQLYQIWINKQTAGISVFTWFAYSVSESIWFIYGIKNKDKPVIAASFLWALMEILVAVGVIVKR